MAIEIIPGSVAIETFKSNHIAKYPTPTTQKERLFPHPTPEGRPSFIIHKGSKVFTMGSCFAREVDKALVATGFNVISRSSSLSDAVARTGADESLYNKYTIQSILNELTWALDPAHPYPGANALIQISDDSWYDPQLGGQAFSAKIQSMLEFRRSYCDSISTVKDADVLIITLGLIESWYDKESQLYLNLAPHPRALKRHPDRFELHVLEYEEIVENLSNIQKLVSKFCKADIKILITVSPVPLLSTFREQDVLVANTYSKSVQRAAVEKFVKTHNNVDYFPSYEFVTLGNPNQNWSGDFRHVNPTVVRRIMTSVMSKYTSGLEFADSLQHENLNELYLKGEFSEVARISQNVNLTKAPILTIYRIGLAQKKIGNLKEALRHFDNCVQTDQSFEPALKNAVAMACALKNSQKFEQLINIHTNQFPSDSEFREAQNKKYALHTK